MSGLPTPDPSNSDSSEIDSDLEDFEDLEFRKIPRPKAFDTSEELEEEASEKVEVNQAKDRSSELGVISVAEEFEKISLVNAQFTFDWLLKAKGRGKVDFLFVLYFPWNETVLFNVEINKHNL